MTILRDLFEKENGITYEEVLKLKGFYESSDIECKELKRPKDQSDKNNLIEYSLLAPICAFLNRENSGEGLLILGARASRGKIEGFSPFETSLLSTDQVKGYLRDRLVSLGSEIDPFYRNIIEINSADNKHIILIEVSKKDPTTYYYSKFSNKSYVREGDSSIELPLSELFRRVESKRSAKLRLKLVSASPNGSLLRFDAYLVNSGNLPGKNIVVFLKFISFKGHPECIIQNTQGFTDVSQMNPGLVKALQAVAGIPPGSPIYPILNYQLGSFDLITQENCLVALWVEIQEERGHTGQIFILSSPHQSTPISVSIPDVGEFTVPPVDSATYELPVTNFRTWY